MKKIFAIALVIVMMAAISIPAFAAVQNHEGDEAAEKSFSSATTIEYGVKQSYTVQIPDRIVLDTPELDGKRSGTGTISVIDAYIANDKTLKLSVTSETTSKETNAKWLLVDSGTSGANPVEYTISSTQKQGDATNVIGDIAKGGTILTVGSAVAFVKADAELTFLANKTMQVATFEDKLTFTVTIN